MTQTALSPEERKLREQLLRMELELARRVEGDAWWEWSPSPPQDRFIRSVLSGQYDESWFLAANRCVTPWTILETDCGKRQIAELIGERGFDVLSWDGERKCNRRASPVFLKGIEPAYRFLTDRGEVFEATERHQVLTEAGYVSLGSLMSKQDGQSWMETDAGWKASCAGGGSLCDQQLPQIEDNGQAGFQRVNGALGHSQMNLLQDVRAPTQECIRSCLMSFPQSTLDDQHLISALCDLWRGQGTLTSDQQKSCVHEDDQLSPDVTYLLRQVESAFEHQVHAGSEVWQSCEIPVFGEVTIIAYQKIGLQPIVDFTVDETHCYVAAGVIHHNSGKTDSAAWLVAGFARFGRNNPRYPEYWVDAEGRPSKECVFIPMSGTVISLDFANSRDVVQPKLFDNTYGRDPSHMPFIPAREIAHNGWSVTNQVLKMKNGNIVGFKSADSGAVKIAGRALDFNMYDEEPPKAVYEETTIRVGGKSKLLLFGACTLLPPEGTVGGVSWVYEDKVKPWKTGQNPEINILTSSIYENPHLLPSEIERLERLYPVGSIQRKIRLEGELLPGMAGSRAYTSFDSRLHVKNLGCEFQPRRPIVWFMDFNVEPLCSGVGQRVGDVFRVYKEIILDDNASIGAMVEQFVEVIRGNEAEIWIYGDASGNHRQTGTGKTEYQLIVNALRKYNIPLKIKVPEANPPVNDRINAVNNALVQVENGAVHVEIDAGCKELIADLEGVLRDKSNGIKKSSNRKDPYFRRTHISDAFGYWVTFEEPVHTRNFQERKDRTKIKQPSYKVGRR